MQTTPPPQPDAAEYDAEPDPLEPLLDRPVRVIAAERIPVDTRIPGSWVAQQTRIYPGNPPVQLAGDHPARTRWAMVGFATEYADFYLSHSAETCTQDSGIRPDAYSLEITGRGPIWAAAFHSDPFDPEDSAYVQIYYFAEYLDH